MRMALWVMAGLIVGLSACQSPFNQKATQLSNLPNLYDRRSGDVALRDEQIEVKAREELAADPEIISQCHINVNAFNGLVLVTGEAPSEILHNRIINKIRILQGVARVQDEIDIAAESDPPARYADTTINGRIRTELDNINVPPDFNSANIKVVTESGSVYLLGLVYRDEGDMATKAAQQVQGVRRVVKLFEYLQ